MQETAINRSTSYHNVPLTCSQLQAASISESFKIINIFQSLQIVRQGRGYISTTLFAKTSVQNTIIDHWRFHRRYKSR